MEMAPVGPAETVGTRISDYAELIYNRNINITILSIVNRPTWFDAPQANEFEKSQIAQPITARSAVHFPNFGHPSSFLPSFLPSSPTQSESVGGRISLIFSRSEKGNLSAQWMPLLRSNKRQTVSFWRTKGMYGIRLGVGSTSPKKSGDRNRIIIRENPRIDTLIGR